MKKRVVLLNDNKESLLNISFILQRSEYDPILFHRLEELVNWVAIYRSSVCDCLVLNGCSGPAVLEKLTRYLSSCGLNLQIVIAEENLPKDVEIMADTLPQVSCCKHGQLISVLNEYAVRHPVAPGKAEF